MNQHWHDFIKASAGGTLSVLGVIFGNLENVETKLRIASLCIGIVAGLVTISLGVRAWLKK